MKRDYRKPLIVFTPKSLLRHPKCVSTVNEFAEGSFQTLINEDTVKPKATKTLVFVSGKFYYDLLERREDTNRDDVAIVRLEQLFPLPVEDIQMVLNEYKNVKDIVWAQEEPRNMGAYSHLLMHLEAVKSFRVATRRPYGAPAAGSSTRSKKRHQEAVSYTHLTLPTIYSV